ncbi:MAG: hypothetical protein ACLR01_04635 [Vescimonas sp.]
MNRKRIRQMNTAPLRRLTGRPTAEYFSGQPLLERLESENYIQRFAPLYDGTRLRCGDVLELCRPELTELSGGEPEVGWLHFAYDFARRQLFPEKEAPTTYDAGAVFFLSLLQVLLPPSGRSCPLTRHGISTFYRRQRRRIAPAAPAIDRCCGSGSGSTSMR